MRKPLRRQTHPGADVDRLCGWVRIYFGSPYEPKHVRPFVSRTEIDSITYICPCGAGTIEKTIVSTDYVFPSADVSYIFRCSECTKVWRLSNGRLVNKESEKPSIEASKACRESYKAVLQCVREIARHYCDQNTFATKKSEFEHLATIGRFNKGYATYLKWRKEGKAMYQILVHEDASSRGEVLEWARATSASVGLSGQLTEVLNRHAKNEKALAQAEKQIFYRSL